MDSNQLEFIRILSDYINNVQADYKITPAILEYAKTQELEGIVYRQTKVSALQSKYAFTIYLYQNRLSIIRELVNELKGIPYFFVKGQVLSAYYPEPSLRTMGDIDIVVQKKDLDKVKSAFIRQGFEIFDNESDTLIGFKHDFEFEIHTSLIDGALGNEKATEYFSHCWDRVEDNKLDKNYHFLFVIQHMKGHMAGKSVGFRQFMDVAFFAQDHELDWKWIRNELAQIDMLEFTKKIFAFIERCFNVKSPFETDTIDDYFFEQAINQIYRGGVFGLDDETLYHMPVTKQAIFDGDDLKTAQCRYLVKQLFPDYKTMSTLYYCSYVKKSRVLLPIAWMHRFLFRIFDREHRSDFLARAVMRDEHRDRLEYLKKWGL